MRIVTIPGFSRCWGVCLAMFLLWCGVVDITARAQGTIAITSAAGAFPRITLDGVNAEPAEHIFVEVLVAGATSLAGEAAQPFALTLSGVNAGLFSKGTLTVGGIPGGVTTQVTIRAWDKDTGDTFDAATVRASSTFALALGGVVDANGIPSLPAQIVGPNRFVGLALSRGGTISMSTLTGTKPRITYNGVNVEGADRVLVEVQVAGATGLVGPAANPFPMALEGASAGLFSQGTLIALGRPAGSSAQVTIRAWDADTGVTFDTATVRASSTFSIILGGAIDANGVLIPPASIAEAGRFPGLSLSFSPRGTLAMNTLTGIRPRVTYNSTNVLPTDEVFLEVLVAGATGLSGAAATPFLMDLSGADAGLFSKGTLTVGGIPGGTVAQVTIRGWDKKTGPTFDTATVRRSTTFPVTLGGAPDANGNPTPPADIVGLGKFNGLGLGLTVKSMPDVRALVGANVRFANSVTADGPFSIHWLKNGITLRNQTEPSLVLESVSQADIGTYCISVTQGTLNVTRCASLSVVTSGIGGLTLNFDPNTQIVQGTTDLTSGVWTDWSFIKPGVPIPIADEVARFIRIRPK